MLCHMQAHSEAQRACSPPRCDAGAFRERGEPCNAMLATVQQSASLSQLQAVLANAIWALANLGVITDNQPPIVENYGHRIILNAMREHEKCVAVQHKVPALWLHNIISTSEVSSTALVQHHFCRIIHCISAAPLLKYRPLH